MRFLQQNLLILVVAFLLVLAIGIWFNTPEPKPPRKLSAVVEPWELPKLVPADNAKALEAINARNLWGIVAANAPKEPEWKVMGIARRGDERFILLAYEGKPIEKLKVGDALPDGTTIAQIENDRFYILTTNKKKIVYGMHRHAPAK